MAAVTARTKGLGLVSRFLAQESPASLPAASSSTRPSPATPSPFQGSKNPFLPFKQEGAHQWTPPKYSLRRQKALREAVELLGWPDKVLPPPLAQVKATSPAAPGGQTLRASSYIAGAELLQKVAIPKKGPYAGRTGAAFKGKLWERRQSTRQAELEKADSEHESKLKAYKDNLKRSRKAPALPF